jgi:hypothetical protein
MQCRLRYMLPRVCSLSEVEGVAPEDEDRSAPRDIKY